MKNNFIVKPNMGILLNYFTVTLPYFYDLSSSYLWRDMNKICKDGKAAYDTFYLFGAFDVLNIGISGDIKKLDEMQKIKSYQEIKGVMDFFIHYGIVVSSYPKSFNFNDAVKQNPVIGIVTIKIRGEAWEEMHKSLDNVVKLKKKIDMLFNKTIKKTYNGCPLNTKNYKAILLLSYDCEDVIIILFTESFQFIKHFTTNLRALELNVIIKNLPTKKIKHLIASTNTILGVNLRKQRNGLSVDLPQFIVPPVELELVHK